MKIIVCGIALAALRMCGKKRVDKVDDAYFYGHGKPPEVEWTSTEQVRAWQCYIMKERNRVS